MELSSFSSLLVALVTSLFTILLVACLHRLYKMCTRSVDTLEPASSGIVWSLFQEVPAEPPPSWAVQEGGQSHEVNSRSDVVPVTKLRDEFEENSVAKCRWLEGEIRSLKLTALEMVEDHLGVIESNINLIRSLGGNVSVMEHIVYIAESLSGELASLKDAVFNCKSVGEVKNQLLCASEKLKLGGGDVPIVDSKRETEDGVRAKRSVCGCCKCNSIMHLAEDCSRVVVQAQESASTVIVDKDVTRLAGVNDKCYRVNQGSVPVANWKQQPSKRTKDGLRQQDVKEELCFYCHKPGHVITDCEKRRVRNLSLSKSSRAGKDKDVIKSVPSRCSTMASIKKRLSPSVSYYVNCETGRKFSVPEGESSCAKEVIKTSGRARGCWSDHCGTEGIANAEKRNSRPRMAHIVDCEFSRKSSEPREVAFLVGNIDESCPSQSEEKEMASLEDGLPRLNVPRSVSSKKQGCEPTSSVPEQNVKFVCHNSSSRPSCVVPAAVNDQFICEQQQPSGVDPEDGLSGQSDQTAGQIVEVEEAIVTALDMSASPASHFELAVAGLEEDVSARLQQPNLEVGATGDCATGLSEEVALAPTTVQDEEHLIGGYIAPDVTTSEVPVIVLFETESKVCQHLWNVSSQQQQSEAEVGADEDCATCPTEVAIDPTVDQFEEEVASVVPPVVSEEEADQLNMLGWPAIAETDWVVNLPESHKKVPPIVIIDQTAEFDADLSPADDDISLVEICHECPNPIEGDNQMWDGTSPEVTKDADYRTQGENTTNPRMDFKLQFLVMPLVSSRTFPIRQFRSRGCVEKKLLDCLESSRSFSKSLRTDGGGGLPRTTGRFEKDHVLSHPLV